MAYQRFWFKKDLLGGDARRRPDDQPRPLSDLASPINAATAVTGSPYFTENRGDRAQMHDGTVTLDYMPSQFITFRLGNGVSLFRHSVLDWPRWNYASHGCERLRGRLPVRGGWRCRSWVFSDGGGCSNVRHRAGTGNFKLHRTWVEQWRENGTKAAMVARFAQGPDCDHAGDHGAVLTENSSPMAGQH